MGNIVTPDQGLLPLPAYGAVFGGYPWWLTAALAIWALCALLCCWLLLLLYLLRYCCQRCRRRQYASERKSLRERFFGAGGKGGRSNVYATRNQHFATAPPPPLPVYAMSDNDTAYRDLYEHRIAQDGHYGGAKRYVTGENRMHESHSASSSEAEIGGAVNNKEGKIRLLASGLHPIDVGQEKQSGGIVENFETNIERNITKNIFINEEQNYYVQKDPPLASTLTKHDTEIKYLPPPEVTTINMAAERIADDPRWEKTNAIDIQHDLNDEFSDFKASKSPPTIIKPNLKQASAEIVADDRAAWQGRALQETQPNVFTSYPTPPEERRNVDPPLMAAPPNNRKLATRSRPKVVDNSSTSEMSGHDSESIYETIPVLTMTRKKGQSALDDEDVYRTAGVDELEIEIEDLVRLQQADLESGDGYDDILPAANVTRRHITPLRSSTATASSFLAGNVIVPVAARAGISQMGQVVEVPGEEEREHTVTETVKSQQVQTVVRQLNQLGQPLDGSAFFIPLTSSSLRQNETLALRDHRDRSVEKN